MLWQASPFFVTNRCVGFLNLPPFRREEKKGDCEKYLAYKNTQRNYGKISTFNP
jgi:hypothetical protein